MNALVIRLLFGILALTTWGVYAVASTFQTFENRHTGERFRAISQFTNSHRIQGGIHAFQLPGQSNEDFAGFIRILSFFTDLAATVEVGNRLVSDLSNASEEVLYPSGLTPHLNFPAQLSLIIVDLRHVVWPTNSRHSATGMAFTINGYTQRGYRQAINPRSDFGRGSYSIIAWAPSAFMDQDCRFYIHELCHAHDNLIAATLNSSLMNNSMGEQIALSPPPRRLLSPSRPSIQRSLSQTALEVENVWSEDETRISERMVMSALQEHYGSVHQGYALNPVEMYGSHSRQELISSIERTFSSESSLINTQFLTWQEGLTPRRRRPTVGEQIGRQNVLDNIPAPPF